MYKFQVWSVVRGYHIYQNIWIAIIGEILSGEKEPQNTVDPYAAATLSTGAVVGHVPQEFSCVFSTSLDPLESTMHLHTRNCR